VSQAAGSGGVPGADRARNGHASPGMLLRVVFALWSLSGATRTALTCENSLNKPD